MKWLVGKREIEAYKYIEIIDRMFIHTMDGCFSCRQNFKTSCTCNRQSYAPYQYRNAQKTDWEKYLTVPAHKKFWTELCEMREQCTKLYLKMLKNEKANARIVFNISV